MKYQVRYKDTEAIYGIFENKRFASLFLAAMVMHGDIFVDELEITGGKAMNAEAKKYQDEVNACTCLSPDRKAYIQSQMDYANDFSDGAFMGYMEESGIDVSELECFSTTHYAENHTRPPEVK